MQIAVSCNIVGRCSLCRPASWSLLTLVYYNYVTLSGLSHICTCPHYWWVRTWLALLTRLSRRTSTDVLHTRLLCCPSTRRREETRCKGGRRACETCILMLCAGVWNSLPKTVFNSDSVAVFKSRLLPRFLFFLCSLMCCLAIVSLKLQPYGD